MSVRQGITLKIVRASTLGLVRAIAGAGLRSFDTSTD